MTGKEDAGGGVPEGFISWDQFAPGQLKKYVEDAWTEAKKDYPECDRFDFVLTVAGNNPITGYSVTLKPHG